jgi:serine/threonine protein kinase
MPTNRLISPGSTYTKPKSELKNNEVGLTKLFSGSTYTPRVERSLPSTKGGMRISPVGIPLDSLRRESLKFSDRRKTYKDWLRQSRVKKIFINHIGNALMHINTKGYRHMDLKGKAAARNILFNNRLGLFFIIDFGNMEKLSSPRSRSDIMEEVKHIYYQLIK